MSDTHVTPTLRRALTALAENGGEGAIDRDGHLLASGEVLGRDEAGQGAFAAVTWLRGVSLGLVEAAGPLRLRLTAAGREAAR